jgi:hypothetical protein
MAEQPSYSSTNAPSLPEVVVPWWQDGSTIAETTKEPHFLSKGLISFWKLIWSWMLFPLNQMDALTCSESLLNLMAWDRDITRFDGESLSLFRKRVKYAAINAKDAGSVYGFKRIFERLEIGIVSFKERVNADEWDVCTIELTDETISKTSKLAAVLIGQYGRTCRRYRFEVVYPVQVQISTAEFSHDIEVVSAQLRFKWTLNGETLLINGDAVVSE